MKTENRKSTVNQNHFTNMTMADRSVRYILAVAFSLFPVIVNDPVTYWFLPITGVWLMMTALIGWDPIYAAAKSWTKQKNTVPNSAPQTIAAQKTVLQRMSTKVEAANDRTSRNAA